MKDVDLHTRAGKVSSLTDMGERQRLGRTASEARVLGTATSISAGDVCKEADTAHWEKEQKFMVLMSNT